MFNVDFDNYDFMDLLDYIDQAIVYRKQSYILTCNVDHLMKLRKDQDFRKVYAQAGAVVADGMPLVWASKLLSKPLKQKVSGADLFSLLGKSFEEREYRLFFLGSAEGIPEKAIKKLKVLYPKLNIVGCYSPSMGFEHNEVENQYIIKMLIDARPDIVFVGVGAPKQEKWIHKHYIAYKAPVSIGVGATFDFIAGSIKRAPKIMQSTGFEWFWRLAHEPRRLWKRYLLEDSMFLVLLAKELLTQKRMKRGEGD
jgi:N-acetylglucosaminyldiphosphoundecaprenol N-acetyl-beta-D-mannosaminyltransferase